MRCLARRALRAEGVKHAGAFGLRIEHHRLPGLVWHTRTCTFPWNCSPRSRSATIAVSICFSESTLISRESRCHCTELVFPSFEPLCFALGA